MKTPKIYTAADALQEQPPIDWIVKDLIAPGSLVMFVGEPGSKKTWALLDMSVCVSLGKPWLERDTKQCKVLIVDEESGTRRLHRRIGQAIKGHPPLREPQLAYTSLNAFNMSQPDDINTLQVLITEQGAQLVIIDTLADIMPGKDENAVKDVQPVFLALRKIAELTSSAIVLIHHTSKSDDKTYRGSSAMAGAVDLLVAVRSSEGKPYINFETTKERDIERTTFAAKAEFTDDQFYLVAADAFVEADKLTDSQRCLLHYLLENKTVQTSDFPMIAKSYGITARTIREAQAELTKRGYIKRQDSGGQGSKATYSLTEAGGKLAEKIA